MKFQKPDLTRRQFLKSTTALGALSILPSCVSPGNPYGTRLVSPNERVNLAIIGIGNQGNSDRKRLIDSGYCNVVALCDVDMEGAHTHEARYCHQLTSTLPKLKEGAPPPQIYPKARGFTDFRKMFDEMADEIDAVLIALPDHSHFSATMLAMSLGKHVYVEKPLAHTFGQCERMMRLARKSGVVTQMGNQGHSGANYFQFEAWTKAGLIKDVTRITAHMNNVRRWHGWGQDVTEYFNQPVPKGMDWDLWLGGAPVHPFSDRLHPQEWRSWFDYGCGAFGDWGPHILDTCHRFLNLGLPETITALKRDGSNPFVYPQASTIQFSFPKRGDMPACDVTWYDGQENKPVIEPEYGSLFTDPDTGKTTRNPVEINRPGKVIYAKDFVFQGGSHSDTLRIIPEEKFMDMRKSLPRISGKNSNHYENFLLACRGEEESRSPFSISGPLTQVFNLGMIAQQLGGEVKFDRVGKKIINNKIANALLDPAPRKGWEEYYKLA